MRFASFAIATCCLFTLNLAAGSRGSEWISSESVVSPDAMMRQARHGDETSQHVSYFVADDSGCAPKYASRRHSCGSAAADCCDCRCCAPAKLLGLFQSSQPGFDDFISPMTNPVYFEDPRNLTEARLVYIHHKVPATALGGEIDLLALQLRAALTDRLSFIATKDGFAASSNPLIDDGWADVSAGLKYTLFSNPASQTILSGGLLFELPVGSTRTLQGKGDGLFNLFLTGGTELAGFHWISSSGFLLPTNRSEESSLWFWSNHFDRRLGSTDFYGLVEFSWYHFMGAGDGGVAGVEGGDLFNFGSTGVAGNDIVTGAFGLKYKPNRSVEIGVAWENPLTDRRDVLEDRLTVDFILRY